MNPVTSWADSSNTPTAGRPLLPILTSSLDCIPQSLASPSIAIRAPTLPFPSLDNNSAAPMYPESDFLSATSYTGTNNFAFVSNSTTAMYGSEAVVDDPEEVGSNWGYDSTVASPGSVNGSDWAAVAHHLSQQPRPLSPNTLARIATNPFSASPSPADTTGVLSPSPNRYSPSHGSRSPSPNPSPTDLTSHSRASSSNHSRRASSASANHYRRRSSNASSNGYSPYPPPSQRSPRPADADSFHSSPEASPATRLDDLHLHSPKANYFPPLPSEKPEREKAGGRYPGKGMRRSREFAMDDGKEYRTNEDDLFVIHFGIPAKGKKTAVTEKTCVQIELDPLTPVAERTGILWREGGTSIEDDGEEGASYVFVPKVSSDGTRPSGRWRVVYSPSLGTLVESLDSPPSGYVPRTTFIHFLPQSIVIFPAQPIGSTEWWRVQVCVGKHSKSPDKGDWSARFDKRESSSDRRPVRVVQHFASCTNRAGEEGGLTGLARAVIAATKGEE